MKYFFSTSFVFVLFCITINTAANIQPPDTVIRIDNTRNYILIDQNDLRPNGTLLIQIESQQNGYTQSWFLVTAVCLLGFIAFLVFRYFLSSSRKNALAKVRIADLERSALQAQMNPHFIFNSLNSIQSYIANNENDKANRYLAKFSRLVRATLNNSRSGKISLEEEIEAVTHYLELEKMRFKEKFDYDITIDDDIITSEIQLPPMLIQPYLENAIIHGLAQTRSKGRISLYYLLIGNYLVVTVTDNGIGIEQSKKMKEGTKALHKSVGMTITQKRLEMLDEDNRDNKVRVEEVKDRLGEVIGTKVEVKIRVQ